ncbi:hypothetical protein HPB48_020601 [Haemaphysalis longicornis]|uniref:DDE-1 domain-containing protein n=1 Tax=Haemaphysalis longicornis TaxID=44386 RepID=A0A9J6GX10_HAELO|nr:hypothetical protein HPB48_020601 [Haemaphysalis longicornis]
MVSRGRKFLPFLDNATYHPAKTSNLRNIEVVFFPPSCTSRLQPQDAGIIKCVEHGYRKLLVQLQLAAIQRGNCDKKASLLDAMHYIASSRSAVSKTRSPTRSSTVASAGKIGEGSVASNDSEFEALKLASIKFAEYFDADDNAAVCEEISLDQAVTEALSHGDADATSEEDDDATDAAVPVPMFAEVVRSMDNVRCFVSAHDTTGDLLPHVAALERQLLRHGPKIVQKLTDFF